MKKQSKNLLKLEHKVLFVFRENMPKTHNNLITGIIDTTTITTTTTIPTGKTGGGF